MAKFYGQLGYGLSQETAPGVWQDVITERLYYGDVLRNTKQHSGSSDSVNADIAANLSISVMADAYAYDHFFNIRYARWAGAYWVVTSADVERPRLIMRIGAIYNGPKAPATVTP